MGGRKRVVWCGRMVGGWGVVGVHYGAGGERDYAGGRRGEERRERGEKRGGREVGGASDLGDITGRRRSVAIDATGDRYRNVSLVERWEADCVYGAERGKQEREGAEGKVQRLRGV